MRGVAPLITALLGIVWLGESPELAGWLGIGLISVGVILLALRVSNPAAEMARHRKAVAYALANAAVIAVYTVVDGRGARLAGDAWSYIVWLFVLDSIPFMGWLLLTRRQAFVAALRARPWRSLAGGGLSFGAYGIAVWAMTRAPVALVASLRETSVLFATLIAVRLLKERLTLRRWMGAGAVVAGVLALKLA
jgi:drug/metabolite transporter (DMT)-like permease